MTSLGYLSTAMMEQFTDEEASDHPTAWGVLNWLKELSIILLQDLAALQVLHPERTFGALD